MKFDLNYRVQSQGIARIETRRKQIKLVLLLQVEHF